MSDISDEYLDALLVALDEIMDGELDDEIGVFTRFRHPTAVKAMSAIRALRAALTAAEAKNAQARDASRLLRMRVLNLLEECDKRVGYKSEYRYTIPWGEALLLREAVNAFDNGDVTTPPTDVRERDLRLIEFIINRAQDIADGIHSDDAKSQYADFLDFVSEQSK